MPLAPAPDPRAIPLHLVAPDGLAGWLDGQDAPTRAWVGGDGLRRRARRGALPAAARRRPARGAGRLGHAGGARRATASRSPPRPRSCPPGATRWRRSGASSTPELEALGWLLADYRFGRYRAASRRGRARLPGGRRRGAARADRGGGGAGADLINTPARDMGPEALEAAFVALAARHGAEARGDPRRGRRSGRRTCR